MKVLLYTVELSNLIRQYNKGNEYFTFQSWPRPPFRNQNDRKVGALKTKPLKQHKLRNRQQKQNNEENVDVISVATGDAFRQGLCDVNSTSRMKISRLMSGGGATTFE